MSLNLDIDKKFPAFRLNLNITVENGITVFFGPSGAGKSVALKLIAGLLTPDSGRIVLHDSVLFDSDAGINIKPQNRLMGYVFQNHSLFPHKTLIKNIMFGGNGFDKTEKHAKAAALIKKFRLEGLEHKYPDEISGGQQQRAVLAMALIRNPRALLLDEPFSALDTPTRIKIRRCLKEVMEKLSIPIILVTHDIFEAYAVADTMVVIHNGTVSQIGTPRDIYSAPASEEVETLVDLRHSNIESLLTLNG